MTAVITIAICALLLIAYVFDLTSSKTRIPSVILLLLLGWMVRQLVLYFSIEIKDLNYLLPFIGTIGLILIVLEGSLELELNKSKIDIIKKSAITALLPMVFLSLLLAFVFQYFMPGISYRNALTNAIPLSVISSSIAIPSVKYLSKRSKEFITYESSLSDIFGIIFFNFVALKSLSEQNSPFQSILFLLLMIIVSFAATVLLAYLLSKIDHPIKFAPIIFSIILIYSIAKYFHLPALIFVMIFGLFLGNLKEFKRFGWIGKQKPELLDREINKFKELNIETTFLIRSLFFILFGFLIDSSEILNLQTLPWALGIIAAVLVLRAIQFKLLKLDMMPMLLIVPRGLINILLFLSIIPAQQISLVNKSLILQIVLITAFIMMIGLISTKQKEKRLAALEHENK
jgi:Kef-type K+ transport system membrane component KefB